MCWWPFISVRDSMDPYQSASGKLLLCLHSLNIRPKRWRSATFSNRSHTIQQRPRNNVRAPPTESNIFRLPLLHSSFRFVLPTKKQKKR